MNWLKHNFARDWHKISLQGILGLIAGALPFLAIKNPQAAAVAGGLLGAATNAYSSYKNTVSGLSQIEAQAKADGTKAVVLTDPQANTSQASVW